MDLPRLEPNSKDNGRNCEDNKEVCDKKSMWGADEQGEDRGGIRGWRRRKEGEEEGKARFGKKSFLSNPGRMEKSSFREEMIPVVGQKDSFLGQGDGACGLDIKGFCQ